MISHYELPPQPATDYCPIYYPNMPEGSMPPEGTAQLGLICTIIDDKLTLDLLPSSPEINQIQVAYSPESNNMFFIFDTNNPEIGGPSLCPSKTDVLSNWLTRSVGDNNFFANNSVSASPEETTACYDHLNTPQTLTFKNKLGQTSIVTFVQGNNQLVFETVTDKYGQIKMKIGQELRDPQEFITALESALATSANLSPDKIKMTANIGFLDLSPITNTLIYSNYIEENLVTPEAIAQVSDASSLTNIINGETEPSVAEAEVPSRTVLGKIIRANLDTGESNYPSVYEVTNPNSPEYLALLSAVSNNEYLSPDFKEKIYKVTRLGGAYQHNLNALCNYFRRLVGLSPIADDTIKLDAKTKHFSFDALVYSFADESGETNIYQNNNGQVYIVTGSLDQFTGLKSEVVDSLGNLDIQGTQFATNLQNNLSIPDSPYYQVEDMDQHLFAIPKELVTGSVSDEHLSYITQPYASTTTPGLIYTDDLNHPLDTIDVSYSTHGNFANNIFVDQKTGVTYVLMEVYNHGQITKLALPIYNLDMQPTR